MLRKNREQITEYENQKKQPKSQQKEQLKMPELNQLIKENNYQQEDSICLTTGLPGIF
ncbi:MAG: hypothetical protein F6K08_00040 [Okeania sp. SIO1H6]|nr:hypothetical protein [Okeania sp. SIO1H6]